MPLKPHKTPYGTYRIRGTHHGVSVDRSAGTRSRAEALAICEAIEREIFETHVLGRKPVPTFAEVAIDYMKAGRDLGRFAEEIIAALGDRPIDTIRNADVDQLRQDLYPNAKPSSVNRWIVAPVSALMNWAAEADHAPLRKWKRYAEREKLTNWRRPAEIEAILAAMTEPESRALAAIYVGCGLRASEAVFMHGTEIAPDLSLLTVLGTARPDAGAIAKGYEGTKGKRTRTVDIPPRARELIAGVVRTGKGRALRNSKGEDWSDRNALAKTIRRACVKAGFPPMSPHDLRHCFATWHNSVHGDPITLMRVGGWTSLRLVERYAHIADRNLRDEVIASGWSDISPAVGNSSGALRLVVKK
jgi:integrase